MPHLYAYAANESTRNSSLQKLQGEWVQALGATIFGIVWVDKPWLWLVDGIQGNC